jgi:hypothetical protein
LVSVPVWGTGGRGFESHYPDGHLKGGGMEGQIKILSVFAFIALDSDGTEGVVSAQLGGVHMPLMGADLAMVAKLRPIARQIARTTGAPITLAHFSVRTDQETIQP